MREDMETYDLQLIKLPHDVFCPRPAAYLMAPVLVFEGRNIHNLHTDTTPWAWVPGTMKPVNYFLLTVEKM